MTQKINELYQHPEKCKVPYVADREKLNQLYREIIQDYSQFDKYIFLW